MTTEYSDFIADAKKAWDAMSGNKSVWYMHPRAFRQLTGRSWPYSEWRKNRSRAVIIHKGDHKTHMVVL